MQYSQIVRGTLMSIVLFDDAISLPTMIGMVLIILAGVIIVTRQDRNV